MYYNICQVREKPWKLITRVYVRVLENTDFATADVYDFKRSTDDAGQFCVESV